MASVSRNPQLARIIACAAAGMVTIAAATAQPYPGDNGEGVQRGIQELNNSGQVGTVTLFVRGAGSGIVVLLHGVDPAQAQSVRLYRGAGCEALAPSPRYVLADLKNGISRTAVTLSRTRLLSGNYNVVVFATNRHGAAPTACGHLY